MFFVSAAFLSWACVPPGGLAAPLARHALGSSKSNEPELQGGITILYRLKVERQVFRYDRVHSDSSDDPRAEDGDSAEAEPRIEAPLEWIEVAPSEAGCKDPCGCPESHDAEAALLMSPLADGEVQVEWRAVKGDPSGYETGILAGQGSEFRYVGPVENACEVAGVELDSLGRLVKFEVECVFGDEEDGCRRIDHVTVWFPSVTEIHEQPKELPWNTDLEGNVYRHGDDPANVPQFVPAPDDEGSRENQSPDATPAADGDGEGEGSGSESDETGETG